MSESLGKTLQKIRESKKLSIEEVSERTRIPKKILLNIEGDKPHEFSSLFYARTFIKTYSRFLGALEDKAVKDFLDQNPKRDRPELIIKGEDSAENWLIKHKRRIVFMLAALFAAWFIFFSLVQIGKFVRNVFVGYGASKEAPLSSSVKPDSKEVKAVEDKKASGIELEITARYNTWIQVMSNGTLLFRGILKKNKSDVWKVDKDISLQLGNAGGVSLKLNGKYLGYAGKKGEKKEIIVTKDGIR